MAFWYVIEPFITHVLKFKYLTHNFFFIMKIVYVFHQMNQTKHILEESFWCWEYGLVGYFVVRRSRHTEIVVAIVLHHRRFNFRRRKKNNGQIFGETTDISSKY